MSDSRPAGFMARLVGFLGLLAVLAGFGGVLLAVGSALGYRFGGLDLGFALLTLFRWALFLAIGAIGIGLLTLLLALFVRGGGGLMIRPLIGMVPAGAFLAFILPLLAAGNEVPPIHDITTDTQDPPVFVELLSLREGASNPAAYPGAEVATQQREAYPDIVPMVFNEPYATVFDRARDATRDLGWTVVSAVPDQGRIEATETSQWFGFTDDIVIRIRDEGADGVRVDMRSKSRVGVSDVGVNAKRIRAFRALMEGGDS